MGPAVSTFCGRCRVPGLAFGWAGRRRSAPATARACTWWRGCACCCCVSSPLNARRPPCKRFSYSAGATAPRWTRFDIFSGLRCLRRSWNPAMPQPQGQSEMCLCFGGVPLKIPVSVQGHEMSPVTEEHGASGRETTSPLSSAPTLSNLSNLSPRTAHNQIIISTFRACFRPVRRCWAQVHTIRCRLHRLCNGSHQRLSARCEHGWTNSSPLRCDSGRGPSLCSSRPQCRSY